MHSGRGARLALRGQESGLEQDGSCERGHERERGGRGDQVDVEQQGDARHHDDLDHSEKGDDARRLPAPDGGPGDGRVLAEAVLVIPRTVSAIAGSASATLIRTCLDIVEDPSLDVRPFVALRDITARSFCACPDET